MSFAKEVVNFVEDPNPAAIHALFCKVSIEKALSVCSPKELHFGWQQQDHRWIAARQGEYDARRKALAKYIAKDKISRETSYKIDKWAASHPCARPVNQSLIDELEAKLCEAKSLVSKAYEWRNKLHSEDRFGWDYATQSEDLEYLSMLNSMSASEAEKAEIQSDLELAKAGFIGIAL